MKDIKVRMASRNCLWWLFTLNGFDMLRFRDPILSHGFTESIFAFEDKIYINAKDLQNIAILALFIRIIRCDLDFM